MWNRIYGISVQDKIDCNTTLLRDNPSSQILLGHDSQNWENPGAGWRKYFILGEPDPLLYFRLVLFRFSPKLSVGKEHSDGVGFKKSLRSVSSFEGGDLSRREFRQKFRGRVRFSHDEFGRRGNDVDLRA